jgi:hypothetical protein
VLINPLNIERERVAGAEAGYRLAAEPERVADNLKTQRINRIGIVKSPANNVRTPASGKSCTISETARLLVRHVSELFARSPHHRTVCQEIAHRGHSHNHQDRS